VSADGLVGIGKHNGYRKQTIAKVQTKYSIDQQIKASVVIVK
jgi:hypothetical protein